MIYALLAPLVAYTLWTLFLAAMSIIRAKEAGRLSRAAFILALPVVAVGVAIDVICNLTLSVVLFLDFPDEWTVSSRMSRYLREGGWRGRMAESICGNLLDPFDPSGSHCKWPVMR